MNSFNRLSRDSTNEATYARSPDWLVIARALWAGKWQIAAIIAVTMVLAAVYVATIEPQYTARTTLSLRPATIRPLTKKNSKPRLKYSDHEGW
jgi:uncharacterized protein involved in exopolysaccharide biosynthesis